MTEAEKQRQLRILRMRLDSLLARKANMEASWRRLETWKISPPMLDAWCADLTDDLAIGAEVATVEVPGQRGVIQIRPAFADRAVYDSARDGRLQPAAGGTPSNVTYNWMFLPGWLKWKPFSRVGTLTAVDHDTDTGTVELDPAIADQTLVANLNINQSATFTDIPIRYMDCNSRPFREGDRVLVLFPARTWESAEIVGYESAPQPCQCTAWECFESLRLQNDWNLHIHDWPGTEQDSDGQPIDYYSRNMYYEQANGGGYYLETDNGIDHRYVLEDPDISVAHSINESIFKYLPQRGLSAEKEIEISDAPWGAGTSFLNLSWRAKDESEKINPLVTPWITLDFARIIIQKAFSSWIFYATDPRYYQLKIRLAEDIQYWQWSQETGGIMTPTGDYRDWGVPEGARFVDFTIFDEHSGRNVEGGASGSGYFSNPDEYFILPGLPRKDENGDNIPYDPLESWRDKYGPILAEEPYYGREYAWPVIAEQEITHIGPSLIRNTFEQFIGPLKSVFDLRDYCTWPIGGIVIYATSRMGVANLIFELDTLDFTETIPMPHLTAEQMDMLRLHNEHREELGLGKLRWDVRLEAAARRHAIDSADNLILSHYGSDGTDPVERIRDAGYFRGDESMWYAYENIQINPIDWPIEDVFQAWLDSSPHRATIEMGVLEDFGLAAANGSDGRRYFVACFGAVSG